MVGTFHGHAHNRACQLACQHPMYIKGTSLTDGKGCEHVFSSSNELARSTRHCSRFHHHQAIEDHFQFWDQDKYALLSKFILNHYREATNLIHTLEQELSVIKEQLRLTDGDFEHFFEEEQKYLDNLKQMPKTNEMKIKYIHALNEMAQWKLQWGAAKEEANNVFNRVAHEKIYFAITQTKEWLDTAFAKFQDAQTQVMNLEKMLNIQNWWTSNSDGYQKFHKLAEMMDYIRETSYFDLGPLGCFSFGCGNFEYFSTLA
ncbi:hypothetical protein F5887DRAFT_892953 [Amanita rubescens]|nr:hypothetical protein F5887DRAFT_892953 [Amanita rubescens]